MLSSFDGFEITINTCVSTKAPHNYDLLHFCRVGYRNRYFLLDRYISAYMT